MAREADNKFKIFRFDKIKLSFSMMENLIPQSTILMEMIEYNEYLSLAVIFTEDPSNSQKLMVWRL